MLKLKLFVLSFLTLFSTVPTVAMLSKVKTLRTLKQRGYSKMTEANYTKLLRYENGLPLSAEKFSCEFDAMEKDRDDENRLWDEISRDIKKVKGKRFSNWRDITYSDGSTSSYWYHYYAPHSGLDYLCRGTNGLAKIAFCLTLLLNVASVGAGFVDLISPEVVSAIQHATLLCGETTIVTGVSSYLLKQQVLVELLHDLDGTNIVVERRKAQHRYIKYHCTLPKKYPYSE